MGNRIVLVTGGSRGIGKAIVDVLSDENFKVIYIYKNKNSVFNKGNVFGYQLDINDKNSCLSFLRHLEREQCYPSILINNAGVTSDSFFHKMEVESWTSVIETNLLSMFNLTQPIYKKMRENKYGRIINISSVNAHKGQVGQVNYCAAKAGILGFTKALALESAAYGITVNSISPGYISTDMVMDIQESIRYSIEKSIPMGRFGSPFDVANLVKYLVSDEAAYITGANYNINGGLYL